MVQEAPLSPQAVEKKFKDFSLKTLENEVRVILKQKKVSPEQYVYWVVQRFKFEVFLAGLGLDFIFAALFFGLTLNIGGEKGATAFWLVLGIGGFFVLTFLILAISNKKALPVHAISLDENSFLMLDLLHKTSITYVQKIREDKWQLIREIEVPVSSLESPREFPLLSLLNAKLGKIGILGLIGFVLMVGLILLLSSLNFAPTPDWRTSLKLLIGLFYLLVLIGFTGRLFTHCLMGFLRKDLIVWTRRIPVGRPSYGIPDPRGVKINLDLVRYTGLLGQYFSILGMLIALFLLGSGLLPVYFIGQGA